MGRHGARAAAPRELVALADGRVHAGRHRRAGGGRRSAPTRMPGAGSATAQAALLGDDPPLHAMLAITGGSAWEAGPETILEAPYASYLFDLIAGPDNWYLVRAAPGRPGDRVRGAAGAVGQRPGAAPRLGGALRRVGERPRAGPGGHRQRLVARWAGRVRRRGRRSRRWGGPRGLRRWIRTTRSQRASTGARSPSPRGEVRGRGGCPAVTVRQRTITPSYTSTTPAS